ncbi:fibronectin type III domain-containing protein [uncultured Desulfuromonas sp.]|uniref:fibronectin type III domain-containing protein n=1 Tax=uncultured Desulfuromonas sp. TaxID=181013 RepID=UPI002617B787|nr:fibronectin type III domain-containing protein [uncultured Desulfuromonas sp.]
MQNIILSMTDTQVPIIFSGPTVSAITDKSVVVEWQTDETATGGVKYGLADPPGTAVNETGSSTTHSLVLNGLTPDRTYYLSVFATDAAGNGPTESGVISFRTEPTPDTTAPVILEGPTVTSITHNSAVVEWTTDEPTSGVLHYGTTTEVDQTVTDPTLSTSHRVTVADLAPETLHYLKIAATDEPGNGPTESALVSFETVAEPDTAAPVIVEGPMAINISDTEATIVWTTDEPATSGVSYNDGIAYGVASDDTLVTEHVVHLTGLDPTTLYTFTVSSKDGFNNGPTLSAPRTFTTLATPDTLAPVIIEGPLVVNTTHQSAVIRWVTDEPADGVIEYGTTDALGATLGRTALVRQHNIPIVNLPADTLFYFRVLSRDAAGNGPAASTIYTFRTEREPDTKKPQVTRGPEIIHKTDRSLTVFWETDEPADTVVNYGQGSDTNLRRANGAKLNRHQVTLVNLQPSTDYSIGIASTDLSGNTVVARAEREIVFLAADTGGSGSDAGAGFTVPLGVTTNPDPDTAVPVITEGPAVIAVTDSTATLRWVTDEIADSRVSYGLQGGSLSLFAGDIAQVTEHVVVLTNLAPATAYSFQAASVDPSGNGPTASATVSFTTDAAPDTAGPAFTTAPYAAEVFETSARIAWDTDEPATTQVKFGTSDTALDSVRTLPGLSTGHALTLTNLSPSTTYYLQAVSMDGSGNVSESVVATFSTLELAVDDTAPDGSISINWGDEATSSTAVDLVLLASDDSGGAIDMRFSNDGSTWSAWQAYAAGKSWTLSAGLGTKTVYAQFRDGAGNIATCNDTIRLESVSGGSVTPGSGVTVTPTPDVRLTFETVTAGGEVTVTTGGEPDGPANFRILPGSSCDVTTAAGYSGTITVCLGYDEAELADPGNESSLALFHYSGGSWTDITTSVDTVNDRVCGETASLSPFLIGEPTETSPGGSTGSGGESVAADPTRVPVMGGAWLLLGIGAGMGLLCRRRRDE